jgi:hypothetical protein
MVEFKYELDHVLEELPETQMGTIRGSIIAKADKIDQDAANEFIDSKVEEGVLDENTGERLRRLVHAFCFYR